MAPRRHPSVGRSAGWCRPCGRRCRLDRGLMLTHRIQSHPGGHVNGRGVSFVLAALRHPQTGRPTHGLLSECDLGHPVLIQAHRRGQRPQGGRGAGLDLQRRVTISYITVGKGCGLYQIAHTVHMSAQMSAPTRRLSPATPLFRIAMVGPVVAMGDDVIGGPTDPSAVVGR